MTTILGQEREAWGTILIGKPQEDSLSPRKKEKPEGKWSVFSLRGILLAISLMGVLETARTASLSFNEPKRRNILVSADKLYFVPSFNWFEDESEVNSENLTFTRSEDEIKSDDLLIDCVKFHFHQRKYFIKQRTHDPLAVRLQLDLIARQMCFSDISTLPSLEEFDDLKLTDEEGSAQGYISKFAFNESQYFSPDDTDDFCRDKSKIFFSQKGKSTGSGMGSRLHMLVTHLHLILAHNDPARILALESGGWVYTNSSQCEYEDLRCYFQQISQCVMNEESLTSSDRGILKWGLMPRWNDRNSLASRNRKTVLPLKNNVKGTKDYVYNIPEIYASRGWLWYYSQIFYFMFQPNDFLENEFSKLRLEFNDHIQKANSIFMHVRHGDKFVEADMFDGSSYLTSAAIIETKIPEQRKQNMTSIFIATDDENIFEQMKETQGESFEFNHIKKNVYTDQAFQALKSSNLDGSVEAVTIFKEIFMAISSDCFIGSFSSGLSRAMFKLMVAIQGDMPLHFSLSPWSHDVNGEVPQLSIIWLWS